MTDGIDIHIGVREVAVLSLVAGIAIGVAGMAALPVLLDTDQGGESLDPVALETTTAPYDEDLMQVGEGNVTINGEEIRMEGRPYLGDPDAPVTMVSYEDFFCPYCGDYNTETFPQIVENNIKAGEVRYVYKHLPVVGGGSPAVAAECALEQDPAAFWTFKHGMFEQQDELQAVAQQDTAVLDESMRMWAQQAGLDVDQFQDCYSNQDPQPTLSDQFSEAQTLGIQATPGFFVNGGTFSGACPYSTFQDVIDAAQQGDDWEVVQCGLV